MVRNPGVSRAKIVSSFIGFGPVVGSNRGEPEVTRPRALWRVLGAMSRYVVRWGNGFPGALVLTAARAAGPQARHLSKP